MISSRSSRSSHPPATSPLPTTSWSLNSPLPAGLLHRNHTNCECQGNVEEMRGFKVFLIVAQVFMLLVVFSAVITVYILGSNTYLPVTIFAYVEVVIFVLALIHACRPSIRMLLFFLALEIANALSMLMLGLVVAIRDGNKDCSPSASDCGFFKLTVDERFYIFWFLLTKSTFALFLGLIAVAHSPQMHDYLAEDEWEQGIFQANSKISEYFVEFFHCHMTSAALLATFLSTVCAFDDINQLLQAKTNPPPTLNDGPLEVKLGMYLESLGNFRSTEMTFDVDIYVYQSWQDIRLRHQGPEYVLLNDDNARKKMWLPDIYFANARQATHQTVTRPNFNLFISPDGQIAYSSRCTLEIACSLDLRFYPMDHQVCSIRVLSYAHIAKQLNVTWFEENALSVNPEIFLPEFKITHLKKDYCNGTYRYALMPNSSKLDDFSCLSGKIFLSRSLGYNLLQSYIPTSLIVMISWVSFWIDRRAVPARVTLSFTTLVSFTTLGSGLRIGAQVSYAKALDIWYGVCLLFVFLALLEFALINNSMRKAEKFENLAKRLQESAKRKKQAELQQKASMMVGASPLLRRKVSEGKITLFETDPFEDFENSWGELVNNRNKPVGDFTEESIPRLMQISKKHSRRALQIDVNCRVLFPLSFMLFNLFYWSYYLVYVRSAD